MDTVSEPAAAAFEATVFLDHFADLPDPRQPGKVAYRLDKVLLLALLAILAEAEGFTYIARFGHKKLALLRRFLPFQNGTPSHDHLGDIFAALDPVAFRRCFAAWAATLTQTPLEVIAIDGKTSRRSGRVGARDALHVVSAFAARQHLVLAQTTVSGKSNESPFGKGGISIFQGYAEWQHVVNGLMARPWLGTKRTDRGTIAASRDIRVI